MFLNAGKLISANSIAAVLGLAAAALTARTLGTEKYGVLALVLVYKGSIGILVTFNAWQAVIKYGSEALNKNDRIGLQILIKFGFSLDIGSAVVGTILAMALSGPVINFLGWDQSVRFLLQLFSVLILFSLSGTPIGVLRLFDRFDLLSYTAVLSALVRLGGVAWCLLTRQSLFGFVMVYLITGIVGELYLVFASLWVLRQHHLGGFFIRPLRRLRQRFPNILDYVWTTNVHSTVRILSREADGLIIAGLTTPAALGLYKIAKQFSQVLTMLINPICDTIFPELSRLFAAGNKKAMRSLIKRSTFFVGSIAVCGWLVFIMLGNWLIIQAVGSEYQDSYRVAVWYMLALVIAIITFSFQPSMLALGLPRTSLKILVLATLVYFVLLVPLVNVLGIVGASLSYIFFYMVWSISMFISLRRHLFHLR
ncbi:MAG: oligosaccharide flippase family protein [Candidatus Aminicenantes bacterium]|nr:oligosaccharide flippase family protein [Candidatus Aminicenantes bacterium]